MKNTKHTTDNWQMITLGFAIQLFMLALAFSFLFPILLFFITL
jgi:hypothetical protein